LTFISSGFPINFKKAKHPNKNFLIGTYTILEPINVTKHADDLFDNFSKDNKGKDWTYMHEGPFKEKILLLFLHIGITTVKILH